MLVPLSSGSGVRYQVPGTDGTTGLARVAGVGNARLFNRTHELLLEIGMGGGVMFMFKIKFNVER